jgi:hypothetical protein
MTLTVSEQSVTRSRILLLRNDRKGTHCRSLGRRRRAWWCCP